MHSPLPNMHASPLLMVMNHPEETRATGDLNSLAFEAGFGGSRLGTPEGVLRTRLGFPTWVWGLLSLLLADLLGPVSRLGSRAMVRFQGDRAWLRNAK